MSRSWAELIASGARRGFLGILSQVLNSSSNLGLAILVARESGQHAFGGWAVAYAFYVLLLQVSRAAGSMPLMISREPAVSPAGSCSASVAIGIVGFASFWVASGFVPPSIADPLRVLGLFLPVLLTQDALRYWYIQLQRPGGAVTLDAVWVIVFAGASIVLSGAGQATVVNLTGAWCVGALVAAVGGCIALRVVPSLAVMFEHGQRHLRTSLGLLADTVLVAGTAQMLPVLVALVGGLSAAGSLRAAQTMMGAVAMAVAGLTPLALTAAVRDVRSGRRASGFVARWSVLIVAVSTLNGLLLLLIPDRLGVELLGRNWWAAAPLFLPLIAASAFRGPLTGTLILLKAQLRLADAVRLRLFTVFPTVGLPVLGAYFEGPQGAVWGVLGGTIVAALLSLLFIHTPMSSNEVNPGEGFSLPDVPANGG